MDAKELEAASGCGFHFCGCGDRIPCIDWSKQDVARMDPKTRKTILPVEWDDPEDDGLYDDLV